MIKRQTDRVRAEKKLEKINLKKVEINKTEAEVKERVEKLEERLRNDFKGEKIETDRPCHAIQKMIKAAEEATSSATENFNSANEANELLTQTEGFDHVSGLFHVFGK